MLLLNIGHILSISEATKHVKVFLLTLYMQRSTRKARASFYFSNFVTFSESENIYDIVSDLKLTKMEKIFEYPQLTLSWPKNLELTYKLRRNQNLKRGSNYAEKLDEIQNHLIKILRHRSQNLLCPRKFKRQARLKCN